jgi:predicted O-linked N-acetylglucosamine transferase (SPINDLY family)
MINSARRFLVFIINSFFSRLLIDALRFQLVTDCVGGFLCGFNKRVPSGNGLIRPQARILDWAHRRDDFWELGVDIAIDLKGVTQDARLGIFSFRAAPIQVSYLGYPGTLGADYIDYLIADKILIPPQSQQHYSEKIVYLPNSYQVNDRHRVIAPTQFTKQELGLPQEAFVFCCFNNNYKITPDVFDSWVRILKAVDASVLWLFEDNPTASMNLQKEAALRGLDPTRLVFAKRMDMSEHLARHRVADLFLDTLPCNAHTTASDALWVGLPVLTCIGESFASRVAASLLNAIELPELVTETLIDYEALAIELATNPAKLKDIKNKLERNRLTTPLFDTTVFTKHIETAYTKMYERYQTDLLPDHIYIDNVDTKDKT